MIIDGPAASIEEARAICQNARHSRGPTNVCGYEGRIYGEIKIGKLEDGQPEAHTMFLTQGGPLLLRLYPTLYVAPIKSTANLPTAV